MKTKDIVRILPVILLILCVICVSCSSPSLPMKYEQNLTPDPVNPRIVLHVKHVGSGPGTGTDWYDVYLSDRSQIRGKILSELDECDKSAHIMNARLGKLVSPGEKIGQVPHVWELKSDQRWQVFDITDWIRTHPVDTYYLLMYNKYPNKTGFSG